MRYKASNRRVWRHSNIRLRPGIGIGRLKLCRCVAIDEVMRVRTWPAVRDGSVVIQVYSRVGQRNNLNRCLQN